MNTEKNKDETKFELIVPQQHTRTDKEQRLKNIMERKNKVVIEEDPFENGRMAYHAYCPVLEEYGAATWGYTKEEALKNIREVVEMVIEELIKEEKT